MYPYEGMFLIDPALHGADPEGVEKTVSGLLEKHGAKIHDFERWDDRKLAYEIKGHRRGVYLLTHFEMPGDNLPELTSDFRITECVLRQLLIRLHEEIPVHLENSAKYQEKMREDRDLRRGRREEGGPPPRRGRDSDSDSEGVFAVGSSEDN